MLGLRVCILGFSVFVLCFRVCGLWFVRVLESNAKGFAICFGHRSWNTAIHMMLGMRIAGGRVAIAPERALRPYDFDLKEHFSLLTQTTAQNDANTPVYITQYRV